MDRSQRPPVGGGGGGGSVRAARERMMAGGASRGPASQIPQPQYGNDSTRAYQQNPQAFKSKQPMPAALSASRGDGQSRGVAISRPTQVPQWPLAGTIDNPNDQRQQFNQQPNYQPPSGRGQAPQRPPRPRNVPSMLDASKIQDHTPSFQYRAVGPAQEMEDDDMMSPDLKSPMSYTSRPSTISSVGTIPDFPMPLHPQASLIGPPRRSANLGPPPSARRGASSYYSNASFVSPIPEESPRTNPSHGSYASSAAMPSRWDDRAREDSYYEDEVYSDDQLSPGSPPTSPPNHHEEANLVRSASFGRAGKPTVVTMGRGSEKAESAKNYTPQTSNKLAKMGIFGPEAAALASANQKRPAPNAVQPEQRNTLWPTFGDSDSPLASGTGFIDGSSSSGSVPKVAQAITTNDASAVPTYAPTAVDPRISQILAATAAASGPRGETPPNTDRSFSRLSAIRRPPKLDIEAVRDAEARGSLTSLPDLIRRATRLAAMMEKGRRPTSRLALNDFSDEDLARDKELNSSEEKRQSGLSGMLAAFPPPGLAGTPTRDSPGRSGSGWPSPMGADSTVQINGQSEKPKRQQRRCCGMPPWVFLLIVFFTLVIIAAAIVVPLELLVLNKPKASTPATGLAACQANTTCANGGTVIIAAGLCSCLCSNGFTGSTCSSGGNASCTTMNVTSSAAIDANALTYSNVTLGDAIPRLISAAQTNFSIPLASDTIIARFNAGSLSCNAENALVTFDGSATRVGGASSAAITTSSSSNDRRDDGRAIIIPIPDVTTSNGGATPSLSPPASSTSVSGPLLTASPTSSAPPSSSTSTAPTNGGSTTFVIDQDVLDFARVAVLYVLQVRDIETAVTSQGNIQKFFSSVSAGGTTGGAGNVTAADNVTVNFLDKSITVLGVKVGGSSSTVSKVRIRGRGEAGSWALPESAPVIVHTGWVVAPLENKVD